MTHLRTGKTRPTSRGWKGRRSGSRNFKERTEPRTENQQGLKKTLETLRAAKGGQPYRGRGGQNKIVARGCRGRQGPGEQVECGKTANVGTSSGGRQEWTLVQVDMRSKTGRGGIIGCKDRVISVKGCWMGRKSGHRG